MFNQSQYNRAQRLITEYRGMKSVFSALLNIMGENKYRDKTISVVKMEMELCRKEVESVIHMVQNNFKLEGTVLEDGTVLFAENVTNFFSLCRYEIDKYGTLTTQFHFTAGDVTKTIYASQCSELCEKLLITDQKELGMI